MNFSQSCPACDFAGAAGQPECPACGLIALKWATKSQRSTVEVSEPLAPLISSEITPSGPDMSFQQIVMIPAIIFFIATILVVFPLSNFLIGAGLNMQAHELGHAAAGWLSGVVAVPLPMYTVYLTGDRSWLFFVVLITSLAYGGINSWQSGLRLFPAFLGTLLSLQVWLSIFASDQSRTFWRSFAGLAGECVIPALVVLFYFKRLPAWLHWPRYRTLFLFIAVCIMGVSLARWLAAAADFEKVPWGSFWGGDGDVEAMLDAGWTVNTLVKVYLRLSQACCLVSALIWIAAARPYLPKILRPSLNSNDGT